MFFYTKFKKKQYFFRKNTYLTKKKAINEERLDEKFLNIIKKSL